MQELIVTILLAVLTGAAGILLAVGSRPGSGMTKRQRRMLGRILGASLLLLVLQLIPESAFDAWDSLVPGMGWGLRLALYLADLLDHRPRHSQEGLEGNSESSGVR